MRQPLLSLQARKSIDFPVTRGPARHRILADERPLCPGRSEVDQRWSNTTPVVVFTVQLTLRIISSFSERRTTSRGLPKYPGTWLIFPLHIPLRLVIRPGTHVLCLCPRPSSASTSSPRDRCSIDEGRRTELQCNAAVISWNPGHKKHSFCGLVDLRFLAENGRYLRYHAIINSRAGRGVS